MDKNVTIWFIMGRWSSKGTHMKIELIQPRNKLPPVAMRFGDEIITIDNLPIGTQKPNDAWGKALIIGALTCGLIDENAFLKSNPHYTKATLDAWKAMDEVDEILRTAGGEKMKKKEIPTNPPSVLLKQKPLNPTPLVLGKTYTCGQWRLNTAEKTLTYFDTKATLAPSVTRALELLFCNPGGLVQSILLFRRMNPTSVADDTRLVHTVFDDLKKTMQARGCKDKYPIIEEPTGYRLKNQ